MTSFRQMLLVSASSLALIYQLALPSAYGQAASGPAFPVTDREGPFDYSEGLIAADPTDASRLLVCTMRNGSEEGTRIEARRSIDSGVSWQRVFVSPQRSADPACAWGRNGNGYLLTLSAPDSRHHQVYRSDDGGHSWSAAGLLTGQFDRPSIVTDILSGRFQDRI